MKRYLIIPLLITSIQYAFGQSYLVKGKVISSMDSSFLSGATVQIGRITTKTNKTGEFAIGTDQKAAILKVAFLGFQSKDVSYDVSSQQYYTIILEEKQNSLDETVVIAYGTTTKRLNTGSVGKVRAVDIAKQPVANPIAALQGRIPGVEITQQSGRTGANFSVLVRGRSSIDNGNQPLYIVDGVPWLSNNLSQIANGSQSAFNSLNPSDIESIEVLKDADATAIYGSRGANGVILITTKKGENGKTLIDLNAYSGLSRVGHTMPLMNTEQYLSMREEALSNDDLVPSNTNAPDLLLYDRSRYVDWKKLLIENTASLSDIQLSLSGGTDLTHFRIGSNYRRETNVYPDNDADKRFAGQVSLDHTSDNSRFFSNITINYSDDDNKLLPRDLMFDIYNAPNTKIYEDNGELAWNENGSQVWNNPMAYTYQSFGKLTQSLISNINLGYSILKNLKVKVNGGYANDQLHEYQVYPLTSFGPLTAKTSGESKFSESVFKSWIVEPQINYDLNTSFHRLKILLGASWQEEKLEGTIIDASDYGSEALLNTTAGAATLSTTENYGLYKYQSFFGRMNYTYKDKYLANLTGRRDGSSRFGPGKQFANFGAAGLAWIFSEELFVKNTLKWFSFGKLRGSFGITGNDKIGNYQFMDTYGNAKYPYDEIKGLLPQRLFNPYYEWESNKKLEFAIDLGFLNDRILFSSNWFRNRSGNQLLQYTLPTQTGFSGITKNLPAIVENKGWEFEINAINIQNPSFKWNSSFNLTIMGNKLLNFPDLETSSYASQYEIGKSLNIFKAYPYLGVNSDTGLWDVDLSAGRKVIKDLTPRFYGGFGNNFQYKNFQLDIFFQFVSKDDRNYLYSLPATPGFTNFNMPVAVLDRWQKTGDNSDIQRFYSTSGAAGTARNNYRLSDGIFVDASYVRLKNLALNYSLPSTWIRFANIQRARVYFQAQNIFTFTGYKGNDPEVTSMIILPPLRTLTIGAQIIF